MAKKIQVTFHGVFDTDADPSDVRQTFLVELGEECTINKPSQFESLTVIVDEVTE